MAANVLNSERAVRAIVKIVRAHVRLSRLLASNAELARKLDELERKYDRLDAIRELMAPPAGKRKEIGFLATSVEDDDQH
ncbi:MAG TPA: hypothetical protein VJH03_23620 [Blastocatellia bacterium]|nr:hypothetical protein [Blastocatellia bacterium]